jgi:hypothetical protein
MFTSFTFWVSVLVVLIAYLCVSVAIRLRADEARRRARERQSPGTAFDVSAVAPQIRKVRQDHLTALRSRQHPPFYRAGLIAAARRLITSLSYFRRAGSKHEPQKHDA